MRGGVVLEGQRPVGAHRGAHRGGGVALHRCGLVDGGPILPVAGASGRGFDLGDRAARGLRVDHAGHIDQRAQGHQHPGRLR